MKVCHFSSNHIQEDIRVFHKECVSLANAGHEVYLVTKGKEYMCKGVHMKGIGEYQGGRFQRFTRVAKQVYKKAVEMDADIYHFHDPDLLPYGVKLKRKGKKVIFDSHEDVPAQILDKQWIPKPFRKIVSLIYKKYETYAVSELDAVVAATPHIAEQFNNRAKKVVVVNNYPIFDDITVGETPLKDREPIICYAGGINELRGEKIMVEAMKDVNGVLMIAGEHKVEEMGGVQYIGKIGRKQVNELFGKSVVGLCLLKPTPNYINSKPIKIYEYMAAGIAFICSDFPLWRKVCEESKAGICVDIRNAASIREKINFFLNNRDIAQEMGKNGYLYVHENANWGKEAEKLIELYSKI